MSHVVRVPPAVFSIAGGALQVHALPAASDNLCWLLVDPVASQAWVVDGPDAAATLAACERLGVRLVGVLNTHTHGDHVGINRDLLRQGLLEGLRVTGARATAAAVPGLTEAVEDGDEITVAGATALVLRTDGHIDGHLCFHFDGAIFCGDTLFTAGCGRLFDGPASAMFASLSRLRQLPDATRVCCAHEYTWDNLRFAWLVESGNTALADRVVQVRAGRSEGRSAVPSTIGEERATNPFLRWDVATVRAAVIAAWPGQRLTSDVDVFAALRAWKDRGDYREIDDGALPG